MTSRRLMLLGFLPLALTGCEGTILGGSSTRTPGSTGGPNGTCTEAAGHYTLRRLTNDEYTNTVQDLLFTTARPGDSLQEGTAGSSGYTNDSFALNIYSSLIGAYYDNAETLAHAVIASKSQQNGAYNKLVTCTPTQSGCDQQTVTKLLRRALRRAPTSDEVTEMMTVFQAGSSFDQGLSDVIVSVLIHPEFVMIPVVDDQSMNPNATFALDDDEVAARLSYFLWQSMPDDALFAAADAKTLHNPAVLQAQVTRMLADPKATHLKDLLRDEYAGLKTLARTDFTQLGQPNALRDALIGETDAFFTDLIAHDRSALDVLTSQRTFANKTLADFYGLTFPSGANASSFVAISSDRTGLASQGAVLVNSAGGSATFTNPIKRGHWLVNKVLCDDPPAPPPGVPALPPVSQTNPTIRQRLEAHVSQPACQGCHKNMDAVGLGAENYDAFGRWRTSYADGASVDATGTLPDGTSFSDSKTMYAALGTNDQAKACVAQQFMRIALSRALGATDVCTAQRVASTQVVAGGSLSGLISSVVTAPQFLSQVGEAP